jgi:hypothetical protein
MPVRPFRVATIERRARWHVERRRLVVLDLTPRHLVLRAPSGGTAWFDRISGRGCSGGRDAPRDAAGRLRGVRRGRGADWSEWRLIRADWERVYSEPE